MRRLPVYLLIDTSGSMSGEPIEAVKNGIQVLVSSLRQNPYALETVFLSVITFHSEAKQVVPLSDLESFQMLPIQAAGTTSLGEALSVLADCIDRELVRSSPEQKGDWRPLVFLMTDGVPTDDWDLGLKKVRKHKLGALVACAAGEFTNIDILKKITDHVVSLETADSSTIKAYFQWVSASIGVGTQRIETTGKEITGFEELPPPPPEINIII